MQTITEAGIKLIASFEGFSATPYNDPPGSNKWSIGFGHQILPGENLKNITVEQGRALLLKDTIKAQGIINSTIKVPLTSQQFDSLTSFIFNVGEGAYHSGSVPIKINKKDFTGAANTMRQYNKSRNANGVLVFNQTLADRRDIEASAFV